MSAGIRVGQRVRVARAVGNGPVNHEGHTGRVLDIADRNRAALIDFGTFERWVPLANVIPIMNLRDHERAPVAEPEGHAEHLDAIEARLKAPTFDTERAVRRMAELDATIGTAIIRGLVTMKGRPAFVPKGGA